MHQGADGKRYLVIHGDIDPLVRLPAGRATAKAVPGAKMLVIEGMGHALPIPFWPEIINAIVDHTHGMAPNGAE